MEEIKKGIVPIEISSLLDTVQEEQQKEIKDTLSVIFDKTVQWRKQLDTIEISGINDLGNMKLAAQARLNIKKYRLTAIKGLDAKRAVVKQKMSGYKLEDSLWLKTKQIVELQLKAIEADLDFKAETYNRHVAVEAVKELQRRLVECAEYSLVVTEEDVETLSLDEYVYFKNNLKTQHEDKLKEDAELEVQRIAGEQAQSKLIEMQQKENDRLLAEKKIEEDKAATLALEVKKMADIAKKALDKANAEIAEKNALDAKNKKDEQVKLQAEKDALQALKEAPEKDQLNSWVNSFVLPDCVVENTTCKDIQVKFEGFKKWALSEINK